MLEFFLCSLSSPFFARSLLRFLRSLIFSIAVAESDFELRLGEGDLDLGGSDPIFSSELFESLAESRLSPPTAAAAAAPFLSFLLSCRPLTCKVFITAFFNASADAFVEATELRLLEGPGSEGDFGGWGLGEVLDDDEEARTVEVFVCLGVILGPFPREGQALLLLLLLSLLFP